MFGTLLYADVAWIATHVSIFAVQQLIGMSHVRDIRRSTRQTMH